MRHHVAAFAAVSAFFVAGATSLAQLDIVNTMSGNFMDISATGTPLNLSDDGQVTLFSGINSTIFGTNVVTISNNMAVGFGNAAAAGTAAPTNTTLPTNTLFGGNQAVAVLWDNPGPGTGGVSGVFYQEFADMYVIQWNMLPKGEEGSTATVELQVFGGSARRGEVFAQWLFQDVEQAGVRNFGTVGYQSGIDSQFNDILYSIDQRNLELIRNGTVLTLTTAVPAPGALLVLAGLVPLSRRRRA